MRGLVNIRASAALTGSAVNSTAAPTGFADWVYLYIGYTMGTGETNNTIIFTVHWSHDGGTTFFTDADWDQDSDAITNGAVTVDKKTFTYQADSAAGTYDYIVLPFKNKGNMVRIAIEEGGVATDAGTCVAYVGFSR